MTVAELKKWRDERQCHGTRGPKGYTTAENAAWLMGGGKLSDKDAKAYLKLVKSVKANEEAKP